MSQDTSCGHALPLPYVAPLWTEYPIVVRAPFFAATVHQQFYDHVLVFKYGNASQFKYFYSEKLLINTQIIPYVALSTVKASCTGNEKIIIFIPLA